MNEADKNQNEITNHNASGPIQGMAYRLAGKWWFWIAIIGSIMAWPIIRAVRAPSPPKVQVLKEIQPFSLIDASRHYPAGQAGGANTQNGCDTDNDCRPLAGRKGYCFARKCFLDFGPNELAGKVWIAGSMCTSCPAGNKDVFAVLKDIQHRSRNLGAQFKIVSFTVAPEDDNPDVIATYLKGKKISPRLWTHLTGERDVIRGVLREIFDIPTPPEDQKELGPILRGTETYKLALIDSVLIEDPSVADGHRWKFRLRGRYDIQDKESVNQLLNDASLVLGGHR
tara:strand:+ start:499 stop:1347 length:849 start_codon:yes stop_codon:yes gene_type:complete